MARTTPAQHLAEHARRRLLGIEAELARMDRAIERTLRLTDSWPSTLGEGGITGGTPGDRTGRAAANSADITRHIDNITDNLRQLTAITRRDGYQGTLEIIENDLRETAKLLDREPLDPDQDRCTGGKGAEWAKLGAFISRHPETGADDSWGDATCEDKAHARGLCNRHYMRARRWCETHGVEWADRVYQTS